MKQVPLRAPTTIRRHCTNILHCIVLFKEMNVFIRDDGPIFTPNLMTVVTVYNLKSLSLQKFAPSSC
jgi:hypothetical protein